MTGNDTYQTFEVKVSLSELIDHNLEGFLDLISELATGSPLLMDINYALIGVDTDEQAVILRVTGDTSAIEENEDKEDE